MKKLLLIIIWLSVSSLQAKDRGTIAKSFSNKETSTYSTQAMVGRVANIVKLSGVHSIPYGIYFESENWTLNFMEKEIELHRKIGEQLLLFEL